MPYDLILDVLLAVLLMVTIGYALVLNKRLNALRKHKEELDKLAGSFNQATERAGDSIGRLKVAGDALKDQLGRAETLRDDLVFLIDRGTAAADRLEENVRSARGEFGMPVGPSQVAAQANDAAGAHAASHGTSQMASPSASFGRPSSAPAGARKSARPAPSVAPGMTASGLARGGLDRTPVIQGVPGNVEEAAALAEAEAQQMAARGQAPAGPVGPDAPVAPAASVAPAANESHAPRSEAERALLRAIRSAG